MKFLWVTVITLLPGLAGATTQKMLLSAAIKDKSVTMDAVNITHIHLYG
jgi:tRNA G37 N-methylase TrmD